MARTQLLCLMLCLFNGIGNTPVECNYRICIDLLWNSPIAKVLETFTLLSDQSTLLQTTCFVHVSKLLFIVYVVS